MPDVVSPSSELPIDQQLAGSKAKILPIDESVDLKQGAQPSKRITIGDKIYVFPGTMGDEEALALATKRWEEGQKVTLPTEMANIAGSAIKGVPVIGDSAATEGMGSIAGIFSRKPDESLQEAMQRGTNERRSNLESYEEREPVNSTIANVVGGTAAMAPIGGTAVGARALGITGKLIPRMLASSTSNAALSGADAWAKGNDPISAGIIGGITGATIPAASGIMGGIGNAVGKFGNKFIPRNLPPSLKDVDERALFWASNTAKNDFYAKQGMSAAEAELAANAKLKELGPRAFLAEYGPNLSGLASATATMPGMGKKNLFEAFDERFKLMPQRHNQILDKTLGPRVNTYELGKEIESRRKQLSDPLYKQFRETPVQPSFELENVLPKLKEAGAVDEATKLARLEGKQTMQSNWPTAETWDYYKRSLDDKIGQSFRAGENNKARILLGIKNELLDAFDKHPNKQVADLWKRARQTYSNESELQSALESGQNWQSLDRDEMPAIMARMNDPQKQMFMQGMRRDLADVLDDTARGGTLLRSKLLSHTNQEKIREVLGDKKTNDLIKYAEQDAAQTNNRNSIMQNSQTAARLETGAMLKPNPEDLLINQATHLYAPHVTPLRWMIPPPAQKAFAREQAQDFEASRDALASLLTIKNKEARDVVAALLKYKYPGSSLNPMLSYWTNLAGHGSSPETTPWAAQQSNKLLGYPQEPPQ